MKIRLSHAFRLSIAIAIVVQLLSLSSMASNQSSNQPPKKSYVPLLRASDSEEAEIALSNLGTEPANLLLTARGYDGVLLQGAGVVNPVSLTLAAGNSRTLKARELFGVVGSSGWIEIETSAPAVNGAVLLRDSRWPAFDAVDFSAPSNRVVFPKVTTELSAANRLALVNVSNRAIEKLTISLYENNGRLLTKRVFSVRAYAGFFGAISSLIPGVQNFDGYVVAEANGSGSLAGAETYRSNSDLAMIAAIPDSAKSRTGFAAQSGDAAGYASSLTLVNTASQAQAVSVIAAIVPVTGSDRSATMQRVDRTLAPGERWEGRIDQLFSFYPDRSVVGYVRYQTLGNATGLLGYFELKSSDGARLTAVAPAPSAYTDISFSYMANGGGNATEITVFNPDADTASISVDVFSPQGFSLGTTSLTLAPNTRWSGQLLDIAPGSEGMMAGRVRVVASAMVLATQVVSINSGAGAIATVPVQGSAARVQASGQTVSAATGGSVLSDDKTVSLYVPPRALPQDTPIVVRSLNSRIAALNAAGSPTGPAGERLVGIAEGTPSGTHFKIPARLRFTLNDKSLPEGTTLSVFIINPTTGAYEPSEFEAVVDSSRQTATAEVTHFTQFAVFAGVQSVRISGVSPGTAPIGATVTISGSGFGVTPEENSVFFVKPGGKTIQTTASSASATRLTVVVPEGATSGKIYVQVGSVKSNNVVFKVLTIINQAPVVDAGADETVMLPDGAVLSGIVADDGLPTGAPVSATWSMISGPGLVTFNNANSINTAASFSDEGEYTLRLTATDSVYTTTNDMTVTVALKPPPNQAPAVSAGPDKTTNTSSPASLTGTATDDGLPNGALTAVWSKVSGPGSVTFGDASSFTTTATFSVAGTYTLRVTASDSELSATDDVNVVVSAVTNQAPTVSAGPDRPIMLSQSVALFGLAQDDGLPFNSTPTVSWTKVSGPGTVTFVSSTSAVTSATFSAVGLYTLRLTASDGLLSASDDVVVAVAPVTCGPTVSGAVMITAEAVDDVGVVGVQIKLDGAVLGPEMISAPYSFSWLTAGVPNGCHTLTAIASDLAGNEGTSDIYVTVNNP